MNFSRLPPLCLFQAVYYFIDAVRVSLNVGCSVSLDWCRRYCFVHLQILVQESADIHTCVMIILMLSSWYRPSVATAAGRTAM